MGLKKTYLFGIILCLLSSESWSNQCAPQDSLEQVVSREDFPWGQSLAEIKALAGEIYTSGKRLRDRAHVEADHILLPMPEEKALSWGFDFKSLRVEKSLLEIFKQHISKIYVAGLGSELIYSDVGHFHIFASLEDSSKLKSEGLNSSEAHFYERILHSKNTKFLYHTSEQLGAPQTDEEKWRKNNRTVVGDGNGNIKSVPFTKRLEGYSQFFSVYLNASRLGCFSLGDEKFDISLSSPK